MSGRRSLSAARTAASPDGPGARDRWDHRSCSSDNLEHPRWDEVSERCLTCGNCTMVCPTCFCTTVEDVTDLAGEEAERLRELGLLLHPRLLLHRTAAASAASSRSRYRQWMTHKLATWLDQFGSSGCVGCGRCITWCPVAIDITEEAAAISASDGATARGPAMSAKPNPRAAGGGRRVREHGADHLELIAGCGVIRAFDAGELPVQRRRAGRHLLRHCATGGWPWRFSFPGGAR